MVLGGFDERFEVGGFWKTKTARNVGNMQNRQTGGGHMLIQLRSWCVQK